MAPGTKILLVKLGGSLITDKRQQEAVRRPVLARLAAELAAARPHCLETVLLGHGSGSFGHLAASRMQQAPSPEGRRHGASATQDAAARLHRLVIEALLAAGEAPFSLAPSSFLTTRRGRPVKTLLEPTLGALAAGMLPVTYGDLVVDSAPDTAPDTAPDMTPNMTVGTAIASTETVLLALARRLLRRGFVIERALWLGETAGIYLADGTTLPRLTLSSWRRVAGSLQGASGTDVTGGIRHRLEAAVALARLGISSTLFDGREPGLFARALAGDEVPGTIFAAGPTSAPLRN